MAPSSQVVVLMGHCVYGMLTQGTVLQFLKDIPKRLIFSPDGTPRSRVGMIRLWDTHNCRHHTEEVYDFALSPDGKMLASGSDDQTIRLWDAQNGNRTA